MSKTKTTDVSLFASSGSSMPEGWYSGGKPNPNLRPFVLQHQRNAGPAAGDAYAVQAFTSPIQTTKIDPIYNLHPYDSKKSHLAIQQYVAHYCKPGDLLLDPFCGSGSTLVAANARDVHAIGIDFSPLSILISAEAVSPCDVAALRQAFSQLKASVAPAIDALYATSCDRCGGPATITGSVISEAFQCLRCLEEVPYFSCIPTDSEGKRLCPHCSRRGVDSVITTSFERRGASIVEVAYRCHGKCKPRRAKRSVLDSSAKTRRAIAADIQHAAAIVAKGVPDGAAKRMLGASKGEERWGLLWRPYLRGFDTVGDFFTQRNLQAVSLLFQSIEGLSSRPLLVALSAILAKCSHLMAQNPDGIGRVMKGTYYVGAIRREVNVWQFFEEAVEALIAAKEATNDLCGAHSLLSCQSSCDMSEIPFSSIDYIFTDPPYSGKVQFGELNFLREGFLGLGDAKLPDEIIVNEVRGLSEETWCSRMRQVAAEMFRVLKPGRWVTLCYHDTSEGTWALVQDLMAEVGFVADSSESAIYIETRQKSIKQITGDKVNTRDLVVNFRKPRPGEFGGGRVVIPEGADTKTFRELARQIMRECLTNNPGSTKDRLYDELVSRMVRAGTMQAHNFDELLREVADEAHTSGGASRWYLKETEESTADAAETAREDKAADVLGEFITKKTDETGDDGVHYSELFEAYLYSVRDKPRRSLADWLPDYYYKTEDGTWRLPASDEERELKEKARATGENRRIKRFANMLAAGVTIPQAKIPAPVTLAEWIRHAKRAGLFEAGKLLYERGGMDLSKLNEEQQVEVEEDYQTCVRALQRAAGSEVTEKKKRGRKKA